MNDPDLSSPRGYPTVDYDQHARTCSPDDFWGQVKRTVHGQSVPREHIAMIVQSIRQHLAPQADDVLLDLACGNGALSERLFDSCAALVGVDLSPYLIDVANQHFAKPPRFTFIAGSAADYLRAEPAPERFTKVLCYGSFAYFSEDDALAALRLLHDKFEHVERIFVGNLPDRDRATAFYTPRAPEPGELTDPRAQIGIWRTQAEFAALAASEGWSTCFAAMPASFFAKHYRYDAVLTRRLHEPGPLPTTHARCDAMIGKHGVDDLGLLGGNALFAAPKSTSNLVQPNFERFLDYSRDAFIAPPAAQGAVTRRLEARLARFHQAEHCIAFCSGFWALAVTVTALALPAKREVVMPSLTYRRMADMVAWTGLLPRFCEVDPGTLAISAATASACIGDDTALLLGVHPIVNGCDVEGLVELARARCIPLMFDSVESVYEICAAGRIGGFGNAECFSLHASKLINGFEGGYVTTRDAALAATLAELRDGGTAGRGALDARLSDIHAAMALANLDELDAQVERNRERYLRYRTTLREVPGVRLRPFDEAHRTSYKNIVIELLDDWPLPRALTIDILNAENVLARSYYWPPLHAKPMAYPHIPATLAHTDRLAERFLLLPCGEFVTLEDIDQVVALLSFIRVQASEIRARRVLRQHCQPEWNP
jgi:dTDP-4-amino-4,6-dideoxygalactose transaminase